MDPYTLIFKNKLFESEFLEQRNKTQFLVLKFTGIIYVIYQTIYFLIALIQNNYTLEYLSNYILLLTISGIYSVLSQEKRLNYQILTTTINISLFWAFIKYGDNNKNEQYNFKFYDIQTDRFLGGIIVMVLINVLGSGMQYYYKLVQFGFVLIISYSILEEQNDYHGTILGFVIFVVLGFYFYLQERQHRLQFLDMKDYEVLTFNYQEILRVMPQEIMISRLNEGKQQAFKQMYEDDFEFFEANNYAQIHYNLIDVEDEDFKKLLKKINIPFMEKNKKNKRSLEYRQFYKNKSYSLYNLVNETFKLEQKKKQKEEEERKRLEKENLESSGDNNNKVGNLQEKQDKNREKKEINKEKKQEEEDDQKPLDPEAILHQKKKDLRSEMKFTVHKKECFFINKNKEKVPLDIQLKTFTNEVNNESFSLIFIKREHISPEEKKWKENSQGFQKFFKQFFIDKKDQNFDNIIHFYQEFLYGKGDDFNDGIRKSLKLIYQVQNYAYYYTQIFFNPKRGLQFQEDQIFSFNIVEQIYFLKGIFDPEFQKKKILVTVTSNQDEISFTGVKKYLNLVFYNLIQNMFQFSESFCFINVENLPEKDRIEIIFTNDFTRESQKVIHKERFKMGHKIVTKLIAQMFENSKRNCFRFTENIEHQSYQVKIILDKKGSVVKDFQDKQQAIMEQLDLQIGEKDINNVDYKELKLVAQNHDLDDIEQIDFEEQFNRFQKNNNQIDPEFIEQQKALEQEIENEIMSCKKKRKESDKRMQQIIDIEQEKTGQGITQLNDQEGISVLNDQINDEKFMNKIALPNLHRINNNNNEDEKTEQEEGKSMTQFSSADNLVFKMFTNQDGNSKIKQQMQFDIDILSNQQQKSQKNFNLDIQSLTQRYKKNLDDQENQLGNIEQGNNTDISFSMQRQETEKVKTENALIQKSKQEIENGIKIGKLNEDIIIFDEDEKEKQKQIKNQNQQKENQVQIISQEFLEDHSQKGEEGNNNGKIQEEEDEELESQSGSEEEEEEEGSIILDLD